MNQMVKFGLILGVICLAATLVLAVTYEVTKPKIDAAMHGEVQKALKTVMPEADFFKLSTLDGTEYFEALSRSALIGYCLKTTGSGYGGYITIMIGFDTKGIIKGVRVLEHQETPGLGSKINEVLPGQTDPYFLNQFKGKDGRGVRLGKDIDAITGATISSKAVTDTVNKAITDFFAKKDAARVNTAGQ